MSLGVMSPNSVSVSFTRRQGVCSRSSKSAASLTETSPGICTTPGVIIWATTVGFGCVVRGGFSSAVDMGSKPLLSWVFPVGEGSAPVAVSLLYQTGTLDPDRGLPLSNNGFGD